MRRISLGFIDDRAISAVTTISHGDASGIWAMGTDTSTQKHGVGRRLLSTAMAEMRAAGTRVFYLGATPAGQRLYNSLGFSTRFVTKI